MSKWSLFEVYGVELEYMIVNKDTMDVFPLCDEVLRKVAGEFVSELDFGTVSWCNELVNHVIELKTTDPTRHLLPLKSDFSVQIKKINELLAGMNACLLPGAMHPWMNPYKETKLWSHEYNPIYEAYNRIFDCRGHGWANLQSTHINLPFTGDLEFGKLHAAIRFLMPIMPALTASSPVADAKFTGLLDYRLQTYKNNAKRIPIITGKVIPEPVFTKQAYETEIFQEMYKAIASHDPEGILQDEWLNSRGAIARFDRGSIEIRILDIQECPAADISIVMLICDTLQRLTAGFYGSMPDLMKWDTDKLNAIFMDVCRLGEEAIITDQEYLNHFGINLPSVRAGDIWDLIYENSGLELEEIEHILDSGTLATRIIHALDGDYSKTNLKQIWSRLADCLQNNVMFNG
jgi:carboxylate-amine ligase